MRLQALKSKFNFKLMNTFQFLMKRKGFCILFLKYLIIKVFNLMNIFQFLMKRKGFCILFLK